MSTGKNVSYGDGREALLSATVKVVAERGLRGLTLRAAAAQAGVNNTLIVHHFGSRENLLAASLEWSVDRSLSAVDLSEYAHDSTAVGRALVALALSEPDILVFQYEMILESSRRPELRPHVQELYRRLVDGLAGGWLPSVGPARDGLTVAVVAALDGLVLQYLARAIDVDQFADAMSALARAVKPSVADAAPDRV